MRETRTGRDVRAGCFVCWGSDAHWLERNAQAVAARHHDATGHATWVEVHMSIYYGREDFTAAPTPTNENDHDDS